MALLSDAQPSRVARSIVLSPRGAKNEVLSSDGLTSLINPTPGEKFSAAISSAGGVSCNTINAIICYKF